MKKETKIQILRKLIQLPTINNNETTVVDFITSLFKPYPTVQIKKIPYAPNRDNLVITIGHENMGPIIGLSGHMDVVAPGTLSNWTNDPFSATLTNDKLFGRGASDMKSGLAAEIIAMLEILESQPQLNGQIRLLATVGEETGEYGAAQLTELGYADHLTGIIIAEPTNNMTNLIYTSRGVIDYEVTSIGKNAHSAHPDLGVNAIRNLLNFYQLAQQRLAKLSDSDPVLGRMTHEITQITGGEQANMIPSSAQYSGNIRTIPNYPNQLIFNELNTLLTELNALPNYELTIHYSYPEAPIMGTPESELVQTALKTYRTVFNHDVILTGSSEASDGSEFIQAAGQPTIIICGPGSPTGHQVDEYVDIDTYLQSIMFYKQLALAYTK